ncbi:Xaa-Pro peptidase family protein [Bosea sp. (in: a-proteobacteria)]|uniref:M24 family metallopeptidase n=1 Tax=Bosea sp. (in: a-proteobacteria) TaxID=1871050 RepID=UPI0026057FE6|nr:Xaa-Pro peptidase family protein [Bosea sp. (in: a-proteobacteria)]MCO5089940.1 Xaa-Pro peptidase family protein [Bosea sp. (in: a-proteobacteria)]
MKRAFDRSEYQRRLDALQARMAELGYDAMLITAPENTYYLSGYLTKAVFTFQFILVERAGQPFLFTRQMEIANAERASRDGLIASFAVYQDDEDPLEAAAKTLTKRLAPGSTVGIELASWTMPAAKARFLAEACDRLAWKDASAIVDRMRLVKSPAELKIMREASRLTGLIADKAVAATKAGRTENDITKAVMVEMLESGSEYPGSWPNILAGERTGLIHAAWENEPIAMDDHVMFEVTGVTHRYHAPCLRTIMIGKPRDEIRRAAEVVSKAHAAAVKAIAPGRPMSVINEAAQAVLSQYALNCRFAKRSGYTFGIGFPPSWGAQWQIGLNSVIAEPLAVGMTFHVVLVGHFPDGRAIGFGETVALLDSGPESWTRGGFFDAP